MNMTLTPAYAVSRQPLSCRKSFRLRPARIFASITIPFVLPDLPVYSEYSFASRTSYKYFSTTVVLHSCIVVFQLYKYLVL
jgi:hypothetical protein